MCSTSVWRILTFWLLVLISLSCHQYVLMAAKWVEQGLLEAGTMGTGVSGTVDGVYLRRRQARTNWCFEISFSSEARLSVLLKVPNAAYRCLKVILWGTCVFLFEDRSVPFLCRNQICLSPVLPVRSWFSPLIRLGEIRSSSSLTECIWSSYLPYCNVARSLAVLFSVYLSAPTLFKGQRRLPALLFAHWYCLSPVSLTVEFQNLEFIIWHHLQHFSFLFDELLLYPFSVFDVNCLYVIRAGAINRPWIVFTGFLRVIFPTIIFNNWTNMRWQSFTFCVEVTLNSFLLVRGVVRTLKAL